MKNLNYIKILMIKELRWEGNFIYLIIFFLLYKNKSKI
jgi:hypothetical protein